jgi:hypothetical protein
LSPFQRKKKLRKVKKSEETEAEKFEEKICHLENSGEGLKDDQMLGGDFSLKANLKKPYVEKTKSNFQKNREAIQEFFITNVEKMLRSEKGTIDVAEKSLKK